MPKFIDIRLKQIMPRMRGFFVIIIFFNLWILAFQHLQGQTNPTLVFAHKYGGINEDAYSFDFSFDSNGNKYITGTFKGTVDFDAGSAISNLTSIGDADIFILKLSSNGSFVWVKQIGSSAYENPQSIKVDGSGNIFIAGQYNAAIDFDPGPGVVDLNPIGNGDVFYSKFDSQGNLLWVKGIGGPNKFEFATKIDIDNAGNVIIVGTFQDTADFDPGSGIFNLTSASTNNNSYLAKYSGTNGSFIWANNISSVQASAAFELAIDASNNIIITGNFSGVADFDPSNSTYNLTAGFDDPYVAKYSNLGTLIFAKIFAAGPNNDVVGTIKLDNLGNIYVTGYFSGTADFDPGIGTYNLTAINNDVFFGKYDLNFELLWVKSLACPAASYGGSEGLSIDNYGNIFLAGYFGGTMDLDPSVSVSNVTSLGSTDAFFAKYNSTGGFLWGKKFGSTLDDGVGSILVDEFKNIYIIGSFRNTVDFDPNTSVFNLTSSGLSDIYFAKYTEAPVINSFNPISGTPGTAITIIGSNFGSTPPENIVKFNNTNAIVSNSTSASITTAVPIGATSGRITITVDGQTATSSSDFDVLAPTILSFSPTSGMIGTTITITGINFTGATAVSFGGTAATSFTVVSSTSITAVIANGASGTVSVTTPGGIATLAGFTYITPPIITGFTPNVGIFGTSVTITGTNFGVAPTNNIVKFNGTTATVIGTPTATSITTTVPSGATTGKITVEVGSLKATSTTNFYIGSSSRLGRFVVDKTSGCAPLTVTIIDTNLITTGDCTAGKPCEMNYEGTGQQNTFTYTYITPGIFKLSVLYQSIGSDDISITVKDCDPPCTSSPITVSSSLTICVGASTTLTASGANTYSWSPATGLSSSTGSSVIATPATTTTYTVIGTGEYGCTNNASVTVTIPPLLMVSPSSTICSGTFTSLIASGASSYGWSPAIGLSTTTEGSVIASPTTTTIYVVVGTDTNGCTQSKSVTVTVNKPCAIPNLANGNGLEAYRIFSIPLKLSDKKIETVLTSAMQYYGGYDQDKWRLVHYSNGNNLNFTQGLSTIEEGKGYWLLSVDPLTISVSGTALPVNQSTPFIMNLDKGWNQIGNPFGFDILWSDVLSKNSNTTSVGELYVYNPATISFIKSDKLPAWGGGFVNTTAVSSLNIPIAVKQATGGRLSTSAESVGNQIDQPSWFVPLKLHQGEAINDLGGIGMHDEALIGRDKYDENSLPRFVKFLELNSYHDEYFQTRFMRDVVPSTSTYNWNLYVESNFGEGDVKLSWEYETFSRNNAQLLLYDKQAKVILDMKKVGEYKFGSPATRELTIMYAIDEKHLSSDFLKLGLPFPNPLILETTIPFITGADEILINVYDMLGRKVKEVARSIFETGYHEIVWRGDDYLGERVSPGMYIIRVSSNNSPAASVRILVK
jgi:hypothetical protein